MASTAAVKASLAVALSGVEKFKLVTAKSLPDYLVSVHKAVASKVDVRRMSALSAESEATVSLEHPLTTYDFYECYEQYWIDYYPLWSGAKLACTAANTPTGCLDEAALETARDACLAVEPVPVDKICALKDQLTATTFLEDHTFTAAEFSDANDDAWTMVYSFLSALHANGTLTDAAMDETCISCVVSRYASSYTVKARMGAECTSANPPVSCSEPLAALDKINSDYEGCAIAITNGVGSLSLFIAIVALFVAQLN